MGLLLIVLLVLVLAGVLPLWGHSREWGYQPSGLLGTALLVVVVLVVAGYIPRTF